MDEIKDTTTMINTTTSIPTFLNKTYDMADDPSTDCMVSWTDANNSFDLNSILDDSLERLSISLWEANQAPEPAPIYRILVGVGGRASKDRCPSGIIDVS